MQLLRAKLAAASEVCEVAGRGQQLESVLAELEWWEAVSKQQVLGPAERVKARAMQATACEIEGQRRAIKSRNARQRADHDRKRL